MAAKTCAGPGCSALIASPREFCHECWMALTFDMREELNALRSWCDERDSYQQAISEAVAYLARFRAPRGAV